MDPYSYLQRTMERKLLRRYVPPWVVVSEHGEIGNFGGDIETFISPVQRAETRNVFDLSRDIVRRPLETVRNFMRDESQVMPSDGIHIRVPDAPKELTITVFPVEAKEGRLRWFCIVFEPGESGTATGQ